jgi:hypothetical protein
MRQTSVKVEKTKSSALTKFGDASTGRWVSIVTVLMGTVVLGAAVRAYNHGTLNYATPLKPSTIAVPPQARSTPLRAGFHHRLSLQPEANRLRLRLGQRFVAAGRELSILTGTLTIGPNTSPVRIVRTQTDEGESLEIVLTGLPAALTWTAVDGARSGAGLANGTERLLIERLALDSPDQFIQAQLRGASYYTVARNAIPAEAQGTDEYAGPVWDLVRIGEPSAGGANQPVSLSRLYYINSSTGLIDKIAYQEQGDAVIAEFSDWSNQAGELEPSHILWKRNNQTVMQLAIVNISHAAR